MKASGKLSRRNTANNAVVKQRLSDDLAFLDRTSDLSKPAAQLAQRLMVTAARRRAELGDSDALRGMTVATLFTALATGMTRRSFCRWLRGIAAHVDAAGRSR